MSIATALFDSTYVITLTGETTFTLPRFGSRDDLTIKNASATQVVILGGLNGSTSGAGRDFIDGVPGFVLGAYGTVYLIRGDTEWVNVQKDDSAIINLAEPLTGPVSLATTTPNGIAFTNQPANDGVEVVSASALDVTQSVTIIGTTQGTDTVVVETVRLRGTTVVSTTKTDWGVILAVKKDAITAGTVTVREASGNATITAGLTALVLSVGVVTVAADKAAAYGKTVSLVASGASTKQLGIFGVSTAGAGVYDSQALTGTTAALSNSTFYRVLEIYTGDLESDQTSTLTTNGSWTQNAGGWDFQVNGSSKLTVTSAGVVYPSGTGPSITAGSNLRAGTFTLSSGSATVANTSVTANSVISLSIKTVSGTPAATYVSAISAGVNFTVTGGGSDNSTYNYVITQLA